MKRERRTALVLSGGFLERGLQQVGFLKAIQDSSLHEEVGIIIGTSVGALNGALAALGELELLDRVWMALQPDLILRRRSPIEIPFSWSFNESLLVQFLEQQLGVSLLQIAHRLQESPIEFIAISNSLVEQFAEDNGEDNGRRKKNRLRMFERNYSSRHDPPEVIVEAVLASSSIPFMLPPGRVRGELNTDGAWLANLPLTYAYDYPFVERIVAFWSPPEVGPIEEEDFWKYLVPWAKKLRFLRRAPLMGRTIRALRSAVERGEKGEGIFLWNLLERLAFIQMRQHDEREIAIAKEKSMDVASLEKLYRMLIDLVDANECLDETAKAEFKRAVSQKFQQAQFSFKHDKPIVPIIVTADSFRSIWEVPFYGLRSLKKYRIPDEKKREFIQVSYEKTKRVLRKHGIS